MEEILQTIKRSYSIQEWLLITFLITAFILLSYLNIFNKEGRINNIPMSAIHYPITLLSLIALFGLKIGLIVFIPFVLTISLLTIISNFILLKTISDFKFDTLIRPFSLTVFMTFILMILNFIT